MAATNPFGYDNWLLAHEHKLNNAGDEFLIGDMNDLRPTNENGNATIIFNSANVNMTLAGLNSATGSGAGVFGESDADGTIGVGMGVVGACDMGWAVAGLATGSTIDPNKFPRQVGVLGLGDNVGVAGYGGGTNADGVQGNGDPNSSGTGVVGFGGGVNTGADADGVKGYGRGTFSGVVGFADPNSSGTGVVGFGGGKNASTLAGPGVRGIGGGTLGGSLDPIPNPDGTPNAVGVFGLGGTGNLGKPSFGSDGVQGVGFGNGAGVAGYGVTFDGNIGTSAQKQAKVGVYGQGGTGVDPQTRKPKSIGAGVFGVGGPGVRGISPDVDGNGVEGQAPGGNSAGVFGTSDDGVGIMGFASAAGNGVFGDSNAGRGGVFQSNAVAQLQLKPRQIPTPQGAIAGQMGDLFVTETKITGPAFASLWFCTTSGDATTARWVKIV
jgi:hypothetical protein